MKTILLLISLISFNCLAGYVAESKINQCNRTDYSSPSACQKSENETCYKVPNDSGECGVFKLIDKTQDNLESPIWATRSMVENCSDEGDCLGRMAAKSCIDGRQAYYSIESFEVWCNKVIGYSQAVIGKELVIDEALKSQKDSQRLALESLATARLNKIIEIKENIVLKSGQNLTATELKVFMNLSVTDIELGL